MEKKKFCQRFKEKITQLRAKFNKFLENHVDEALAITTIIKNAIDNPIADILVKMTKTTTDDVVLEKMKTALSITVDKLAIVNACNEHEELEAKIQCWIKHIKLLPKDAQDAMLAKFGQVLTAQLDGNKESQNIYDAAFQNVYTVKKHNV